MTAKPFCDGPFSILKGTSWIVGKDKDGNHCHVLDQRGWGYLTGKGHAAMGLDTAIASVMQADMQQWVVDAMNAAWNRRADLAAVQPAQVRVKPLVWVKTTHYSDDNDNANDKTINALSAWKSGKYLIIRQKSKNGLYILKTPDGEGQWGVPHLWQAQDAARHHAAGIPWKYSETGILAAIEPQPDPRDEVIARLVWACEEIASITVHSGGDVHGVTSRTWQGAFQQAQDEARAALAAAKAVQK